MVTKNGGINKVKLCDIFCLFCCKIGVFYGEKYDALQFKLLISSRLEFLGCIKNCNDLSMYERAVFLCQVPEFIYRHWNQSGLGTLKSSYCFPKHIYWLFDSD